MAVPLDWRENGGDRTGQLANLPTRSLRVGQLPRCDSHHCWLCCEPFKG